MHFSLQLRCGGSVTEPGTATAAGTPPGRPTVEAKLCARLSSSSCGQGLLEGAVCTDLLL